MTDSRADDQPLDQVARVIADMPMRSLGPAFMGGRIADIAIHPNKPSTWYVAVGSGGVWKTTNAGTTWSPLFDEQASYSIGCVAIDPSRPDVIWAGTGEAVSGRHVAWGDGVYRSADGGTTWRCMGLRHSEHIAEILIDPTNTDIVYVAAEGPLWSAGGERGVYKTTDGGETWSACLTIDADTGVTSLAFAPDDPTVLYAAAYQRRRRVWSFLGGGSGSGIYKSTNAGETWQRITQGLPKEDMGKIGLAVTAADADLVYATIEGASDECGFYRSRDRGESWEKRNKYVSGGTGPHYYQELFASPTDADRVYQVDVFVHWTNDGGASINRLETGRTKHSDNHVVWIDPTDGDHLLIGADAGLYETFDHGESFRHIPNMPISQFYRVAVDNSVPFTKVLGGAQDLGTLYGPLRTTGVEGVRNQDWTVPLGADGYHVAFDPEDPAISYFEWQNGNVVRHNRRTMELQDIQPQPEPSDPPERWNWDCPIVVSSHDPGRIYVASQRVWRSEDRGESWTAISGDLTRDLNRYTIPPAGRVESVDALWDHMAMSRYCTITYLSESPIVDGLLYVGTDDGLVQISQDSGETWQPGGDLPGFPADGFINNVRASEHDADTVYVVGDAHKNGDYSPYVFVSTDRGASWTSLSANLPDGTIVWAVVQDHEQSNLLFLGTEFGIYVTVDGGASWHPLAKDVPTIAFRDLALQRRDGDLVGATFGRGFYVLDDYSALRSLCVSEPDEDATLFPIRDAWWYVPHNTAQSQGQPTLGSTAFCAPNPDFGATLTYHVAADELSTKGARVKQEKIDLADDVPIDFPGWDTLADEDREQEPALYVVLRDHEGHDVRRIPAATTAGLHRTAWDLRRAAPGHVDLNPPAFREPWDTPAKGPLVGPGTYTAHIARMTTAGLVQLGDAQSFRVVPIPELAGTEGIGDTVEFWDQTWQLHHQVLAFTKELERLEADLAQRRADLALDATANDADFTRLDQIHRELRDIRLRLKGDPVRERLSEAQVPSITERVARISSHHWETTQPPTATQRASLERAAAAFAGLELPTL